MGVQLAVATLMIIANQEFIRKTCKMLCLADLEAHAKEVLDRNAWGYYSSGADAEQTLEDNQEAFSR